MRRWQYLLVTLLVSLAAGAYAVAQTPELEAADPDQTGEEPEISEMTTGVVMRQRDMLQYCVNISDEAKDARNYLLAKELTEMQNALAAQLVEIQARAQVLEEWVERREHFVELANDTMIGIFKNMRPDAAAAQLSELSRDIAAAVITKLDAKTASDILTEMDPKTAAAISAILAGMARPMRVSNG